MALPLSAVTLLSVSCVTFGLLLVVPLAARPPGQCTKKIRIFGRTTGGICYA
jgi:hypothetical protein